MKWILVVIVIGNGEPALHRVPGWSSEVTCLNAARKMEADYYPRVHGSCESDPNFHYELPKPR